MIEASLVNLAELGVLLVGVVIALQQLRDIKKTRETELETRQAQLFMEMYRDFKRPDVQKAFHDIVNVWNWESFEDFEEKYGPSNWDENSKYMLVYSIYEGLGVLIYRELIDVKMIDELMRSYVTRFWEKIGPMTVEVRTRYQAPLAAEWTEYLYKEVKKVESTPAYLLKSS